MRRLIDPTLRHDIDESELDVDRRKTTAAGLPAVTVALKRAVAAMGPRNAVRSLLKLNQVDGFDCQGCAWPDPDPDHRHTAEFCENGAKAVADEGTTARVDAGFMAEHSVAALRERSEFWLNQQGRITEPLVLRPDAEHYEPISWDDAFTTIAEELNGLGSPDEAVFYTSGKTSNEAAYVYQLFARAYGTNNLPDCSNMCHESTSFALAATIGIGKASVTLDDVHQAELIMICGQNPGTNHPRMLTALETAKQNGAIIIAVNPLPEAGLMRFNNPQTPRGLSGVGTQLADLYLPIRVNGDLAFLQAVAALLLEYEDEAAARGKPGSVLDLDFISRHTVGFDAWQAHLRHLDWDAVYRSSGLSRRQIEAAARLFAGSKRTITCWAMGITQHRNAVATVKELVNLALLQGNIGKPGAGLLPVRGHSNVQGDRTMGIWEQVPPHFLDAIRDEFGFEPPRHNGWDTVRSIEAMRDGRASVFVGLGGNFASAAPDTEVTEAALGSCRLTVQVSTKLNRSHLATGRTALILPVLGRSERDRTGGKDQRVTVEDSVCAVHASRGPLKPAGPLLRSEVDIICSVAAATLGDRVAVPWAELRDDYDAIRRSISRVVPGCEAYAEKVDQPGGFVLEHPPRDSRTFPTDVGKAIFTVSAVDEIDVPPGCLLLQTLRSHDQFNTTIYGLDDRYRGVSQGRRVVFVSPDDMAELGLAERALVDIESVADDGSRRRVSGFRVVGYPTPRGCAAAYYPETNPLVPLASTAVDSNQPTSKSVVVRLLPEGCAQADGPHGAARGGGSKADVDPYHLS
jgi:formate dehydrogenase major subunit